MADIWTSVSFDEQNNVVMTVKTDEGPAKLEDPAFNPANCVQLRFSDTTFSAPDIHALKALMDTLNPDGKALRDVSEADALNAKAATDSATLSAAIADAAVAIAALDPKATPRDDVASLQAMLDAANAANAQLQFALKNAQEGKALDATPIRGG